MIEKIGIVGGGQLGRMLTEAAQPLGFDVTVLESTPDCPAAQVGAGQVIGSLKDPDAIRELANKTEVITWEIEHIDADTLQALANEGYNVQSSPFTLAIIQDKYEQKEMLRRAGLPVAESIALPDYENERHKSSFMEDVVEALGKVIVKTRKGGYDGRGNHLYTGDIAALEESLGSNWNNLYVEKLIGFEKELSVVAGRDIHGNISLFPTAETLHKDNICHTVVAPANIAPKVATAAQEVGHETLKLLEGAGVFAIEMFALDDSVVVNEIAPRVHNSGHHTIEANKTSQFEQHIRAITGLSLGSTKMRAPAAAMINILGKYEQPLTREGLDDVLVLPDTHPHFYGKASRPDRKIGHITVLGNSVEHVTVRAKLARAALAV